MGAPATVLAVLLAAVAPGEPAEARDAQPTEALDAPPAAAPGAAPEAPPRAPPPPPTPRPEAIALARAARGEVKLGEPFDYELEVRHAPGITFALPPALDLAPFRATGAACEGRTADGGPERGAVTVCRMKLALFDLGPHEVPAIVLAGRGPEGEVAVRVPGPRVTGAGVISPDAKPDELALRDLAPPVPLLVPTWAPVAWLAGGLAAAALAFLLWRAWRRRARAAAEPPEPVPAHLRLARALDALESDRLCARGEGRAFWVRLSALVRDHLGEVAAFPALDLTSAEIEARLRALADPRLDAEAFAAFAREADLVKFAKAEPSIEGCADGLAYARGLLARTAPAPAAVSPAGARARLGAGGAA